MYGFKNLKVRHWNFTQNFEPIHLKICILLTFIIPADFFVGRGHKNGQHLCVRASIRLGFPTIIWKSNHSIHFKFGVGVCCFSVWFTISLRCDVISLSETGGRFKRTYELLNLRALKFSPVNKIHILQCMGKIFCVEFQRYPLKFHTKYLTHTLKDTFFTLKF